MPRDAASRPHPTSAQDRRQVTLRQQTVTRASVAAARSRALATPAWTQDQRPRPGGMSDAEWACVLLRDAAPGSAAAVIALALACEVADRAEVREGVDPRQLRLWKDGGR